PTRCSSSPDVAGGRATAYASHPMPHPYRPDPAYLSLAAELAKSVLAPRAAEVDLHARFPRESIDALAPAGLFGLCLPESVGGKGQGMRAVAAVAEELAQG